MRGHREKVVFEYVGYLTANIRVLALLVAHFPSSKWLVKMANAETLWFAGTVAVVEDDLAEVLVIEGEYEAEHSEKGKILHFPIEFGRNSGLKKLFVFVRVEFRQLVTFL